MIFRRGLVAVVRYIPHRRNSPPFPPWWIKETPPSWCDCETILFFQWKDKRFGLDGIFMHSKNRIGSRRLWNYSSCDLVFKWLSFNCDRVKNWKFSINFPIVWFCKITFFYDVIRFYFSIERSKEKNYNSLTIIFLLLANLWLMTWFLSYW